MTEVIAQFEFPWVAELPKREQGKVFKAMDVIQAMSGLAHEKGVLVPVSLAAKLLGVSRQRVAQLMDSGKLERVEFDGHLFIPENSLVEFAKTERKNGRPVGVESVSDAWKVAREFAKESISKKR